MILDINDNSGSVLNIINLSDEILVKMFYDLNITKAQEKRLMFMILKVLVARNKLELITANKLNVN
ncbi:MAG: hypothetical protein RDU14_06055 [Melioribacteraceae bacterium]|nr:hypothetical protein [Melioribacteraceae bacterium]